MIKKNNKILKNHFSFSILIIFFILINFNTCLRNLPINDKQFALIQAFIISHPNIEILSDSPMIFEGQSSDISIRLKNQPMEGVLIPITINSDLIQFNNNSLYFSPDNWDIFQTIQIIAPNDDYYNENFTKLIGFGPFESNDPLYNGRTNSFNINYVDFDIKGLSYSINPINGMINEGSNMFIYISLYSKPRDNVIVNLTNPSPSDFTFSSTSLTFTPSNWNTTQSVTVSAIDNVITENNKNYNIIMDTSSNDANFNQLEYSIPTTIVDNDIPGFIINPDTFSMNIVEGNSHIVEIRLNTQPDDIVNVTISSSTTSLCTITSGSSLTFTPSNYNLNQTFTVQARPADDIDNLDNSWSVNSTCVIDINATSTDTKYNGLSTDWRALINDFRNANFIYTPYYLGSIFESSTSTITFTIQLSSKPTDTVVVCFKSSNYCEIGIENTGINAPDGTCSSIAGIDTPYVSFDNTNWNIARTIHVKPRHDWNYRSTPTETGNTCNPPYPDGSKSYNIRIYTSCSGCNEFEKVFYHVKNPSSLYGPSGSVYDDLDYFAFVTSDGHNGDFLNDTILSGSNAIIKADNFCNLQKPTSLSGTFYAFLVDSSNRKCIDPSTCSSRKNWMLKTDKYYFRYEDNQLMFKTNTNALFIFSDSDSSGIYGSSNIWTGIDNTPYWSSSSNNCNNWIDGTSSFGGFYGYVNNNITYSAISNGFLTCDTDQKILCIQQ